MVPMPLGDGVRIAMIGDRLSRLLEARSLFARVEVLVTNLVSDPEGDQGSWEILTLGTNSSVPTWYTVSTL